MFSIAMIYSTCYEKQSMKHPTLAKPVRGSRTGRPVMVLLDLLGRRMALRILWELSRAAPPAGASVHG